MNLVIKVPRLFVALALMGGTMVNPLAAASMEESVTSLIPRLAASNVPERYAAQMELQKLAMDASKPGSGSAREQMGQLLAAKVADANVPQPARVWIVRQLEYMGSGESVRALTLLLGDKDTELRECSRRALEKNPSPDAATSLRAALQTGGEAFWKVGLINALGQRADAASVAAITPHLDDEQTRLAAALALGRIATADAVEALRKALSKSPQVADGLILAANKMAAGNKGPQAREIYQNLFGQAALPAAVRAAALTGLAKTDAATARSLVLRALEGTEANLQNAAVVAAPEAFGAQCSSALAELMPRLAPRVKALVLNLLDASVEKTVLGAARDADAEVRLAALDAMGRMGGALSVSALLQATLSDVRAEKKTAETALVKINGQGAGKAMEEATISGEVKTRVAAINALMVRRQISATPALLRCAEESDESLRKAALSALGRLAGDSELEALAKLALKLRTEDAFSAVEGAVQRIQDKPAAAAKLIALARDEATQVSLVNSLSALGGPEALAIAVKLTASSGAGNREAAIQALGNWCEISAAKPLLTLASDPGLDEKLHKQSLQSIARLVESSEVVPAETVADTVLAAMAAARNEDDKKLVLPAFAFAAHPKAVAALKPFLADAGLKNEAGRAGIALAELLNKTNKAASKELAQNVKDANISSEITRRATRLLSRP